MPTKKSSGTKKSSSQKSSGSDPRSKKTVHDKVGDVMHEFKHHELKSGGSKKTVKNPKQAIAIGLSEARRAGAKIPANPNEKKNAGKKSASKKTTSKKSPAKKSATKKAAKKR